MACGNTKEIGVEKGSKLCLNCKKLCIDCKVCPPICRRTRCDACIKVAGRLRTTDPVRNKAERIRAIARTYRIDLLFAKTLSEAVRCVACQKIFVCSKERHIDHCHKTGEIRGVLCRNCNVAIGLLGDDFERVILLAKYIGTVDDLRKAKKFIDLMIELEGGNIGSTDPVT